MYKFKPALLILTACSLLLSCNAPQPANTPPIRFDKLSKINLAVSSIKVQNDYQPAMRPPHVEHRFPTTPQQAIGNWVGDRLQAVGHEHSLLVIIKNAEVIEEPLPRTPGIKGIFTTDQESRLSANLSMELRIYGDRAISLASTEVHATRTTTLPEGLSLVKRDEAYDQLTRNVMQDLNAELEKNIQQYFANYIHYSYQ